MVCVFLFLMEQKEKDYGDYGLRIFFIYEKRNIIVLFVSWRREKVVVHALCDSVCGRNGDARGLF